MPEIEAQIDVDRSTLGKSLRMGPLVVPPFQREYSWGKSRVGKLFDDFGSAMQKNQSSYFLGSIVLTPGHPPNIIDGQQRLATTTILLAAIRDRFLELGRKRDADSIHGDFLLKYDRVAGDDVPRLGLNTDDREFMKTRVLDLPDVRGNPIPRIRSHHLIDDAANEAKDRVSRIIANADSLSRKADALNAWVNFIDNSAVVVMLTPPNTSRAYQIFTTQNDRAQHTTPVDMIKSHLFEQSQPQIGEAQSKWSSMRGTIEELGRPGNDDPLLAYLHHVSIVLHGPVKSENIFELMEESVIGRGPALSFLESLSAFASDYAAMLTPSHTKWGKYDRRIRKYVEHISVEIKMPFIRPLMLAVTSKFSVAETLKAYRMLVSWIVRFLIAGGSRSGIVEKAFGEAANAIYRGRITSTKELAKEAGRVVPSDPKFRQFFTKKSVSSGKQSRFLLKQLEAQIRHGTIDDLVEPVDDTSALSLEHILPKNLAAEGWDHFTMDQRRLYRNRLGNVVLINAKDNGAIGDAPFSKKRPIIKQSSNLKLTADVIARTKDDGNWTAEHIEARQESMAILAIKRWPLSHKK